MRLYYIFPNFIILIITKNLSTYNWFSVSNLIRKFLCTSVILQFSSLRSPRFAFSERKFGILHKTDKFLVFGIFFSLLMSYEFKHKAFSVSSAGITASIFVVVLNIRLLWKFQNSPIRKKPEYHLYQIRFFVDICYSIAGNV